MNDERLEGHKAGWLDIEKFGQNRKVIDALASAVKEVNKRYKSKRLKGYLEVLEKYIKEVGDG